MKFILSYLLAEAFLFLRGASVTTRSISEHLKTFPNTSCFSENEGETYYNSTDALITWICKSGTWAPFELIPSTGKERLFSASSCKEIKKALSTDCTKSPVSGVYWVQGMQIHCDMTLDDGGWILVWQHQYMKYATLYPKMFYYSNYSEPCVKYATEWCNVPNKARFDPTEQMIVAYQSGTAVYAYKGYFNRNIDYHWTGGILLDAKKVVDNCIYRNGIPPAPSVASSGILGLSFDKRTPTSYYLNSDTYSYGSTLTNPGDSRWADCKYSTWSRYSRPGDMTIAIYVR